MSVNIKHKDRVWNTPTMRIASTQHTMSQYCLQARVFVRILLAIYKGFTSYNQPSVRSSCRAGWKVSTMNLAAPGSSSTWHTHHTADQIAAWCLSIEC